MIPRLRRRFEVMVRSANVHFESHVAQSGCLGGKSKVGAVFCRSVWNLNVIGFVPAHHLIACYTAKHGMHDWPLPSGHLPAPLGLLVGQRNCPSAPKIGLQTVVLDIDAAPYDWSRFANSFNGRASQAKKGNWLALAKRAMVAARQM